MKVLIYAVIVAALLAKPAALRGAERTDSIPPISIAYGLSFETNFDNREYRPTAPAPAQTIFGARIVPSAGILLQSGKTSHSVMAGLDVLREFGKGGTEEGADSYQLKAIQFYYRMNSQFGKTRFTMTTGIFPKSFGRKYPTSFLSDSLRFYDNNYEGLLMTFSRPKAYYEIGCDWIGLYEAASRERFMIFSQGEAKIGNSVSFGYYANMFHYSGSWEVWGVVDNILLYPWIGLDMTQMLSLDKATFKIGWLQAAQNDRRNIGQWTFPGGVQLNLELSKWNFGLNNELYYGQGLMPYYNLTDAAGNKYGNSLYYGSPFYRIIQGGCGVYDKAEIFYEPHIADFLRLRISAVAHIGKEFLGWQQCFSLIFDIGNRK